MNHIEIFDETAFR